MKSVVHMYDNCQHIPKTRAYVAKLLLCDILYLAILATVHEKGGAALHSVACNSLCFFSISF